MMRIPRSGWRTPTLAAAGLAAALILIAYATTGSVTRAATVAPNPTVVTSEFQQAILADGTVTEAEYVDALNKAADCVAAAGLGAVRPGDPQLGGELKFMVNVGNPKDFEAARQAAGQCETKFVSALEQPWTVQQQGGAQGAAAWKASVARCLRAAGASVSDALAGDEITRIVEGHTWVPALAACERDPGQ